MYCELWGDLRSLELDLINSLKNSTKDEDIVHDENIWTKIIPVTKYEIL